MTYELNGTRCIRVVYQDPDNIIRILYRDGTAAWAYGATFPAGIQGSSIACSYVEDGTYNRFVYYQLPDTTFVEYVATTNGAWGLGKLSRLWKSVALPSLLNHTLHERWFQVPARV